MPINVPDRQPCQLNDAEGIYIRSYMVRPVLGVIFTSMQKKIFKFTMKFPDDIFHSPMKMT